MQRRTILKQMLYVAGGVVLLPACVHNKSKSAILLKQLKVDGDEEQLMADLCETIIPATDTPGAKDLSAHLFTLMMVDDCYKKEDQQKFINGLKAFEGKTKKDFSKAFVDLSAGEKEKLLAELEARKDDKEDLSFFYTSTKRLAIQAYTTSKYFLTKVQVYELVPGRYRGCVPVKKIA